MVSGSTHSTEPSSLTTLAERLAEMRDDTGNEADGAHVAYVAYVGCSGRRWSPGWCGDCGPYGAADQGG